MNPKNYQLLSSFDSIVEVRRQGRGHLLIQGDSGFETFLSCPINQVECAPENLFLLMLDLESLSQVGRLSGDALNVNISTAGYEAWIICAEFNVGEIYQRGEIRDTLWLSPQFEELGLASDIRSILSGKKDRLSLGCHT